jgi:hypothetical protein
MRLVTAIAVLIGLPLSMALADVYRSVDAQGHVQYSDTPTPGAELVRIGNSRISTADSSTAAPSSSVAANSSPKSSDPIHDQLSKQAIAREVQNDVAQTRADQCRKAQDDYQKQVQARRIYNTGADGERQYLTDAEADQHRLDARLQMEDLCKPQ